MALPLFALVLVLLLVMVAFAVDLGATAERRRSTQNMADAAALAAAYELGDAQAKFASGSARDAAIDDAEAAAKEYVANNGGIPAGDAAWDDPDCTTDDKKLEEPAPNTDCISFSTDLTQVRVRIPKATVEYHFAPVIGIDSGVVRASAVAEVISSLGGGTRPILLIQGNLGLNCIEDGDSGTCQGASLGPGNFGVALSPRYRAVTGGNDQDKSAVNFALGIDHMLRLTTASGTYCDEGPVNNSAKCNAVGGTPAGNASSTYDLAHYVVTGTGQQLGGSTRGLLGDGSAGTFMSGSDTVMGLLYRPNKSDPDVQVPPGSPATPTESFGSNWTGFNGVHLARYLLPEVDTTVGCPGATAASVGTRLSAPSFDVCNLNLSTYIKNNGFAGNAIFSSGIADSPRFGVAPVTDSTSINGSSVTPVVTFYGIYIDRIYANNLVNPNAIKSIQAFIFPLRMIESTSGGPGPGLPYLGGPFGVRLIR